ncbi:uncharacterized protein LOC111701221 [Eurytemora carolleeae]|uniref:uncharacterized protein LOC111701221 n=1 Tax=Eurytemora carolleeae TaxID=1294199 RepID=UPI000C787B49|nr:uncharacterized protein LOC111701221 [Eurytemora carolleeae]|eukprot:XP_023328172.1 uncharacterized protein LOC111701221 [Eurytemora affinis]
MLCKLENKMERALMDKEKRASLKQRQQIVLFHPNQKGFKLLYPKSVYRSKKLRDLVKNNQEIFVSVLSQKFLIQEVSSDSTVLDDIPEDSEAPAFNIVIQNKKIITSHLNSLSVEFDETSETYQIETQYSPVI